MFFAKTAPDWADQGASCLCRSTSPDISSSRPQIPEVKMHPIAAAFQSWACQVFSIYEVFSCPTFLPKFIERQLVYGYCIQIANKMLLLKDCPKELWGDRPGSQSDAEMCGDVRKYEKCFRALFSPMFFHLPIAQLRTFHIFAELTQPCFSMFFFFVLFLWMHVCGSRKSRTERRLGSQKQPNVSLMRTKLHKHPHARQATEIILILIDD